jgi:tRNA (guanine-N7-)-methyltransferase
VEIGSGKGRFVLELAAAHPDRNFLAVERAGKYHALCCHRAARRGLENLRLLRTSAEDLLFRLLEPSSVTTIYVLFPDPWPKKRHHKRRLITPDAVAGMAAALRPGGRLLVKSDHPEYAEVISRVLETSRSLESIDPADAFEGLPTTGFEHKYLDQGRRIFSFACRKSES